MAADRATGGYWLVSADGTVTGFDAPDIGPRPGAMPDGAVIGVAGTADGRGFWEVTRAGSVYAYGDAAFLGPYVPLAATAPVDDVAADPGTGGYWLVGVDGNVYPFGAGNFGAG